QVTDASIELRVDRRACGGLRMESSTRRIAHVDAFRGIAALIVVVWHYSFYFDRPLPFFLEPFHRGGLISVYLFFVSFVFILPLIYLPNAERAGFASHFIIRRLARLYPLHVITLFVTTALIFLFLWRTGSYVYVYGNNDVWHFTLNLFLLHIPDS